jgi:hypothetical protein
MTMGVMEEFTITKSMVDKGTIYQSMSFACSLGGKEVTCVLLLSLSRGCQKMLNNLFAIWGMSY